MILNFVFSSKTIYLSFILHGAAESFVKQDLTNAFRLIAWLTKNTISVSNASLYLYVRLCRNTECESSY